MITLALALALPLVEPGKQDRFQPVYKIEDIKAEIIYVDDGKEFFVAIDKGSAYIGNPISSEHAAGTDTPYTRGYTEECSTADISCLRLGAYIFAIPHSKLIITPFSDRSILTVWPSASGGFIGSGAFLYDGDVKVGDKARLTPRMTYQYYVDGNGTVDRIIIRLFSSDTSMDKSYDLSLKTKAGINLGRRSGPG